MARACSALVLGLSLVGPAASIAIADITKCQAGKADLVGDSTPDVATDDVTAFTVQVCNLFGATCYVNQVETASADCATQALKVENQQCALFPILSYKDNDRATAAKQQVGSSGCSISCSGTDCKFSGGCVSVQCSLGGDPVTYAGPAFTKTGSGSARSKGITDTATATFVPFDFIRLAVSGSKTVFLSRTGGYVGAYKQAGSASGTNTYKYGELPTIAGNNYGPKACPSSSTLASASSATKEELRMCGSTGKWVYFGAANLLMDKDMYAKYSGDTGSTALLNINNIYYLSGNSAYRSGTKMDDARAVKLLNGGSSAAVLMTSETITPAKSSGMATPSPDIAGTWRFYQVAFYCDLYTRTDLTTCPEANRKMFYVADPNPKAAFGTTAATMGGAAPAPPPAATTSGAAQAAVGMACLAAASALIWL
jgi:hypothetical protein